MRFIAVYLGVYFVLVAGALVALWAGGVLAHLPALGVLLALGIAAALGVLAAVVWRWNPHPTRAKD